MSRAGDLARWESLELWKKDVDMKFQQSMANSNAQTLAIDELRTMLSSFLEKEKSERVMRTSNMNENQITAAEGDITLSDSGSDFEYRTKGGNDVQPESLAKHCNAVSEPVHGPQAGDAVTPHSQPQVLSKAGHDLVRGVTTPHLPPTARPKSMPTPCSHAAVEGLEDNHGAVGKTTRAKEHAKVEDSDDGEWDGEHIPTPDSGCLSPSTLNEDAHVVEPVGELTAAVGAAPAAPSPSQKKSNKAPKSPLKVLLGSWTLWMQMGLPAHGLLT
jgi:hypothetical protein